MIHAAKKVEAIRSRADSSIQAITAMTATIPDPGLRGQLKQLTYLFSDVQTFFLDSLARESRTPEAESDWLTHAEMVLTIAEKQLEALVVEFHAIRSQSASR